MKKLTAEQKRLFKAAEKGDSETIAALIKAGVDINCVTDDGYISGVTPLMIASNHGHTKAVRSLLQGGADVKCRTKSESRGAGDETALHYAIVLAPDDPNDPEVIRLLLEAGADPNAVSNGGTTPLEKAVSHGQIDIATILLEHGADLNFAPAVDGRHPLVAAAGNGDVDMVRWLTERGARLESVSSGGQTPLIAAVARGWEKVAEFLLEEGVDPAYKSPTGRTALRAAVIYGRDAKLEDEQVAAMRMVRRFVELKCDVNSIDADGKSLLDHAVLAHFSELPEYLKSKGAKTAKALLKK